MARRLFFNEEGRIRRLAISGGEPTTIDTGFAVHCNNDHGISPDGKWLAISDQSQGDHQSLHLYRAHQRRKAPARHGKIPVVLARLVTGRQNSGLSGTGAMASSTFTRFPRKAAKRKHLTTAIVWMTARNTRGWKVYLL